MECILNDKDGRGYFPAKETESTSSEQAESGAQQTKVPSQDARRSGRILVQSFNAWPGDGHLTLRRYDVFFRMRRAKHLANTLMRAVKAEKVVPQAAWELVNHYFKLYEIVKWAMVSWVNQWDFDWKSLNIEYPSLDTESKGVQARILGNLSVRIWTRVDDRLRELLQSDIPVPFDPNPDTRQEFYEKLTDRLEDTSPSQNLGTSMLDAMDNAFKESLLRLGNVADPVTVETACRLRDEFCHFLEVDRQLFLLQEGSGFESMDMIRVVRFSPLDAQRCLSKGSVRNKVRGSALASFGGFFNKSWRANDIMIGRLDAACLLVECLLTKGRLAALAARRNQNPVSVSALELQNFFPNLGDKSAGLATLINDYLRAPGTATDEQWNRLIDQIVCACHDEIQRQEWPLVVACAIEQEYDWGRYRKNTGVSEDPFDRKNLVWNRANARPDEILVQVAAQGIAAKTIPPFAPGEEDSGNFLDEIPDSVLNELGALTAIRLGKGLLASIRDEGMRQRVEANAFFKFLFKWIAPVFYNWGRMRRTQPDTVIILNTAIPAFCLTAFAMDVALAFLGVHMAYRTWGLIVGAPALVLGIWGWLFRR